MIKPISTKYSTFSTDFTTSPTEFYNFHNNFYTPFDNPFDSIQQISGQQSKSPAKIDSRNIEAVYNEIDDTNEISSENDEIIPGSLNQSSVNRSDPRIETESTRRYPERKREKPTHFRD